MRAEVGNVIEPCWALLVRRGGPQPAVMDTWRQGEHAIVISVDIQRDPRWTSQTIMYTLVLLIGRRVRLIDVCRDSTLMFKVVS